MAVRPLLFNCRLAFISVLIALNSPAVAQPSEWHWQNPLPTGEQLNSVSIWNPTTGLAVGAKGTILRSLDGGSTWALISSPVSLRLNGVVLLDATTAVAVGDSGTILRTTDGGISWDTSSSGTSSELRAVTFADASTGLATGDDGVILRTIDGGLTWDSQDSGTLYTIHGVSMAGADTANAVGEGLKILRTTDGGATWHVQISPYKFDEYGPWIYFDVFLIDGSRAWAVGEDGAIIKTVDGGDVWTKSPGVADHRSVAFANAQNGLIVGSVSIMSTSDGGETWVDTGPDNVDLYSVDFSDTLLATAVGASGAVYQSTDGGTSWVQRNYGPGQHINDMHFVDPLTGTAVGDQGVILRTTNGGSSWEVQNSGTTTDLTAVYFTDPLTGTVVSDGDIFQTGDGGQTWQRIADGINAKDVAFADAMHGMVVGVYAWYLTTIDGGMNWEFGGVGTGRTLYGVTATDSLTWTVVGENGQIVKTIDGGDNWSFQAGGLGHTWYDVDFDDPLTGTVVGIRGRILRTYDGGRSWAPFPRRGIADVYLYGVDFTDPSTGTVVGRYGHIYRTTDGGDHWVQQTWNVTGDLYDIFFVTPTHATAVGSNGVILQTTDAGQTWTPRSGGGSVTLRGINYRGNLGFAVGDSKTILKTTDGGMTWDSRPNGAPAGTSLRGVSFVEGQTWVAVGSNGATLRTTNEGDTWQYRKLATVYTLNDISEFQLRSQNQIASVVGDHGVIFHTYNGGQTWSSQQSHTTQHLYAVTMPGPDDGVAVGFAGAILRTDDGGNLWKQEGVPPNATTYHDVEYIDDQTGVVAGARVLRTIDGGENWVETNGSASGYAVSFAEDLYGLAVGYGGKVFQTNDGGLNWTQQPAVTSYWLNAVTVTGANTGFIAGDYGLIMGTNDPAVPTFVSSFQAQNSSDGVALAWVIRSDDDISGFRLYRNDITSGQLAVVPSHGLIGPSSSGFVDRTVEPGHEYVYTLVVVLADGGELRPATARVVFGGIQYRLSQNYPNPFNPQTTIEYSIRSKGLVRIEIFDVAGRLVRTLVDDMQEAGARSTTWNGKSNSGTDVASGVYFYRLQAGKYTSTRKLVLLR